MIIVLVNVIINTSSVFETDNLANDSVNGVKMGREYNVNWVVCISGSVIDNGKTAPIIKNKPIRMIRFNTPQDIVNYAAQQRSKRHIIG